MTLTLLTRVKEVLQVLLRLQRNCPQKRKHFRPLFTRIVREPVRLGKTKIGSTDGIGVLSGFLFALGNSVFSRRCSPHRDSLFVHVIKPEYASDGEKRVGGNVRCIRFASRICHGEKATVLAEATAAPATTTTTTATFAALRAPCSNAPRSLLKLLCRF